MTIQLPDIDLLSRLETNSRILASFYLKSSDVISLNCLAYDVHAEMHHPGMTLVISFSSYLV